MAVENRLYSQDHIICAIYGDGPDQSSPGVGLIDLISIFKTIHLNCILSGDAGRATSESIKQTLFYEKEYTIELGAVADPSFITLFELARQYGAGPFWIWIQLYYAVDPTTIWGTFVSRAQITRANIISDEGPVTHNGTLEVIQEFEPLGGTNKLG